MGGIQDAQTELKSSSAFIAPGSVEPSGPGNAKNIGFLYSPTEGQLFRPMVHMVDFDIAVSASDQNGTGGKIGVAVLSLGASTHAHSGSMQSLESRIKFSIPVGFPSDPKLPSQ